MQDQRFKSESDGEGGFCLRYLSGIDFFGQEMHLQIKQKQHFQTTIGIFVSLTITLTCLLFFSQEFYNVIFQQSPQVSSSESINLETQPIQLKKNNFTMAIVLTDLGLNSLSGFGSIYKIAVKGCKRSRIDENGQKTKPNQTCTPLNIEQCQLGKHFVTPQQEEYFRNYNLNNVYCVNPDQTALDYMNIQGDGSSDIFQYVLITVSQCNNITSNNTCSPIEIINKQLSYGTYVVYLLDNLVDMSLQGNPYTPITQLFGTTFSNFLAKGIDSTYEQSFTQTDEGLILSTLKNTAGLIYGGFQEYQIQPNPQFFIYQRILLDAKKITYQRSYRKIQNVFGGFGGLWSVLYYICLAFMGPLVKKLMYLQLLNKLFTFDNPGREESLMKDSIIQKDKATLFDTTLIQGHNNLSEEKRRDIFVRESFEQNRKLNSSRIITNSMKIKEYIRTKQYFLTIRFRSVIGLVFCGCQKKQKAQIAYGTQKVVENLDVYHIITKLQEVEKLKSVLLNEDQLKLFNYVAKPNIQKLINHENSKQETQKADDSEIQHSVRKLNKEGQPGETLLQRVTNAYEAYKKIQFQQNKSLLDENLVKCLDDDITQLFYHLKEDDHQLAWEDRINQVINQDFLDQISIRRTLSPIKIQNSPLSSHKKMVQVVQKQADSYGNIE